MMNHRLFFLPLLLLLTMNGLGAEAATLSLKLNDIMAVQDVRLQGVTDNTDNYDFKLSIPRRWKPENATLRFSYAHSSALIKERSRLIFYFQGRPMAQIPLDPLSPEGILTVSIPGGLLTPGYHSFRFEAAQHSVPEGCEDPSAPELWTWIGLSTATLDVETHLNPVPLRLSAVAEFVFDSRNPVPPPVHLVFPGLESPALRPVGLSASGVSLRYEYRRAAFFTGETLEPDMDTLLIGPTDFVESILSGSGISSEAWRVQGPSLSIHPLPVREDTMPGTPVTWRPDPSHALILITGRNWDEVAEASRAFSLFSLPLPDARAVIVGPVSVPELDLYTVKNGIRPGRTYTLSSLGFETTTFKGIAPVPRGFGFRIPSDTHLSPNSHAILDLDLDYGSQMREDSVLNIQLNDTFIGSIPCSDPRGGSYRHYEIRIPLSAMNPGFNQLVFAPQLTPLITDRCTMIQTGNLRLTLSDHSTFFLPVMDHWIEMPDLGAFMTDAFPFGRIPDMAETMIAIPDKTRSSFAAAVNLMATAAQKTGFPPLGAEWRLDLPETTSKDMVLVSVPSSIPEVLKKGAPLALTSPGPLSFPHLSRPAGYGKDEGEGIWSRLIPSFRTRVVDVSMVDSRLVLARLDPVLLEDRAALMAFQSPFDRTRTVLMLTAQTQEDMRKGGLALWDAGFQTSCKGDTALMNLTGPEVEGLFLKLGPGYYLGGVTPLPFLEYYANTHSVWFIAGVALLCMCLALLIYAMLRRRAAGRVAAGREGTGRAGNG